MFRNIITTIATRVITAALTLLVVIVNARQLGAGNLGTISLIILAVTIIQLFNNFLAGGALIYMTPRAGVFKLFIPAVVWIFVVSIFLSFILYSLGSISEKLEIIPHEYFIEVLVLSLMISLASMNFMFLLGMEKVKAYNLVSLIQIIILLGVLCCLVFIYDNHTVMAYFWASLVSYIMAFLISMIFIFPSLTFVPLTDMKKLLKEILRFGTYIQFANIFQQLNYRLSYYIVDFFSGRAALGIYSVGVQVSEGLWLIPRSIGMVQFSRISNEDDPQYAKRITLTLAKITWIALLLIMILLILIPGMIFQLIFGNEFNQIRPIIASLGVGIILLGVSMIFSQFFSGMNRPFHNTISSAIGLVITLGCGLLLIPKLGIIGAGITASISYTAATLYQILVFMKISCLTLRDFLIRKSEILLFIREIKKIIRP